MDRKPTNPQSGKSRDDRLKAALRANLQRRKAQARAREADGVGAGDADMDHKEQES
jgi:hypothetical protein